MAARCIALNVKGEPCGKWAKAGSDRCDTHSMTEEEWREQSRRGAAVKAQRARERAGLKDSGGNKPYAPEPTLQRAIEVIGGLLDATVPLLNEPDYEQRAYGVLALATIFRFSSAQRDEILETLARVRPRVASDPHAQRLLDLSVARRRLVAAYEAGRISADELPPGALDLRL